MAGKLGGYLGAVAVILALTGSAVTLAVTPAGAKPVRESAYVLGEYRGCVAIYESDGGLLPSRVTDISVKLLPEADQSQLRRGIAVDSRRELLMLLEDFNS